MKAGERLVWAAAFADAMSGFDPTAPCGEVENRVRERLAAEACAKAYAAVVVMRKMAEVEPHTNNPALTMLRDMAGESN